MMKVLVFGTFDGLHLGHEDFLSQARELGDELVVCVAQDPVVELLKQRTPQFKLEERLRSLQSLPLVTQALAGDPELGDYACYRQVKPDLVAFGYDQTALATDFKRFQQTMGDDTPTIVLKPYQPETYKSSLLRP